MLFLPLQCKALYTPATASRQRRRGGSSLRDRKDWAVMVWPKCCLQTWTMQGGGK